MPEDLTQDEIAEAIATEVAERIRSSHPRASGHMLRRYVRLYTHQALGLAPPPGRITDEELGEHLGLCRRRIGEARNRALLRAYQAWRSRHPESSPLNAAP